MQASLNIHSILSDSALCQFFKVKDGKSKSSGSVKDSYILELRLSDRPCLIPFAFPLNILSKVDWVKKERKRRHANTQ